MCMNVSAELDHLVSNSWFNFCEPNMEQWGCYCLTLGRVKVMAISKFIILPIQIYMIEMQNGRNSLHSPIEVSICISMSRGKWVAWQVTITISNRDFLWRIKWSPQYLIQWIYTLGKKMSSRIEKQYRNSTIEILYLRLFHQSNTIAK